MAALTLLAAAALWPGLHGGFVFDDYPNLQALGAWGPVDSLPALARYLTSGFADATGRPLSMLSFLLDARDWPADPLPFKRTNLLIHLLNGLLLFAATRELARAWRFDARRRGRTAALAAGLWLLHPLFVSTVMYVVQREAMLPATFSFATFWVWLILRRRRLGGQRSAIAGMALVVSVGTLLAMACKPNGILLPALLLVIEACLPLSADTPTAWATTQLPPAGLPEASDSLRRARFWLLAIPSLILLAGILAAIPGNAASSALHRPWTLGERLLSEPRVLFDYVGQLVLPRPFSRGLFNDDYPVSHSLFDPWTTAPALAGWIALAWLAWLWRLRFPAFALAIGFYLVGQSIESGPLPLELYFEHRNYLPAAFAFLPLACWLTGTGSMAWLRAALAFALPMVLAVLTWISASLWGNPLRQALVWADRNPDSPRAQAFAAQFELGLGQTARAERRLRDSLRAHPQETQLWINLAGTRCVEGSLAADDVAHMAQVFRTVPDLTRLASKWMREALPLAISGQCRGFGTEQFRQLAQAFADNPRTAELPGRASDAQALLGQVALAQGRTNAAYVHFGLAFRAEHNVNIALTQAALLASAHQPRLALAQLALATAQRPRAWYRWRSINDVNDWVMYRQGFWKNQIDELRGKIEADLKAKQ